MFKLKGKKLIKILRKLNFFIWTYALCLTDFYMEMSTGVPLLRTFQSLLPGGSKQASTLYQPARDSADFFVVGLIPYIPLSVNNFSVRMGI